MGVLHWIAATSVVALAAVGVMALPAAAQQETASEAATLARIAPVSDEVASVKPESTAAAELAPASTRSEPAAKATAAAAAEPPKAEPEVEATPVVAEPEPRPAVAPATIIADPLMPEVRTRLGKAVSALGKDERTALQQLYAVEGIKPLWVADGALSPRGAALRAELQNAGDWGLRASDFDVGPDLTADATPASLAEAEIKLSMAALKYARHARGGRADPAQISTYLDRKPQFMAPKRILEELAGGAAPDAYLRRLHPQHPQFEKLRQAYLTMRAARAPTPIDAATLIPTAAGDVPATTKANPKVKIAAAALPERGSAAKLIANMEMWRWMPADLGATHLLVNVPEFQFRFTRNGQVVHTERVITGKPETQTPIFSDIMETVVFKPTWNVPDSIKVKELLPALSKNPQALARQGLRVAYNGKEIDPTTIDWSTTDIRALHVFQPPSGDNALGIVKFLFPNKHAVYLHDTPTKALFGQTRRTFSHGCIRVRNPVRLAEVIMEGERNWSPAQVAAQLAPGAADNNHTTLTRKFPVHIAYFTAWANETGEVQYFPDAYGYDTNINLAIDGKAHLIALKKEEKLDPPVVRTVSTTSSAVTSRSKSSVSEWSQKAFGNGH